MTQQGPTPTSDIVCEYPFGAVSLPFEFQIYDKKNDRPRVSWKIDRVHTKRSATEESDSVTFYYAGQELMTVLEDPWDGTKSSRCHLVLRWHEAQYYYPEGGFATDKVTGERAAIRLAINGVPAVGRIKPHLRSSVHKPESSAEILARVLQPVPEETKASTEDLIRAVEEVYAHMHLAESSLTSNAPSGQATTTPITISASIASSKDSSPNAT